jgi:hypothetical protein
MAREHVDATQARCVSGYVFRAYNGASLRIIMAEGIQSLSQDLWAPYLHAVAGCTLTDQLRGKGLLPSQPGTAPPS